jgi:hypothetical protein
MKQKYSKIMHSDIKHQTPQRTTRYLPPLFSLFLNDLETFLEAKNVTGLESISGDLENQLNIYLRLFIILYADDTVILTESESDLQAQLVAFHEYCLTWKLKVNIDKTKIVIFGSGRTPQHLSFKYNGSEIEVVKNFNYLGIIFRPLPNMTILVLSMLTFSFQVKQYS